MTHSRFPLNADSVHSLRPTRAFRFWASLVSLGLAAAPFPARAMQAVEVPNRQMATRTELSERLAAMEKQAGDPSAKKDAKARALAETTEIRKRLAEGDFQVGDRFTYTIVLDTVSSDTASVRSGQVASISNLPDVRLKGVLRSELNELLKTHVSTYVKNATVRSLVLTRVSVLGAVLRPGYYYASPDRAITELVMLAGGPAVDANLAQIEVRRDNKTLLSAKDSKEAVKEGRTLEQVDIRSGDEVTIPTKKRVNWQAIIQLLLVLSSAVFAFFQFISWYYSRQG